jgi:hypothetical protein
MSLKGFFVAAPADDGDAVTGHYYEVASPDLTRPQVWGYTDHLTYAPGEILRLHLMSTAPKARVRILRDGIQPETLWDELLDATFSETPADCSVSGCGWPVALELPLPMEWVSGVYVIRSEIDGHSSEHMFVLRAVQPTRKHLFLLATGTWCAYNDWGGSNHYQGLAGPQGTDFAAEVSMLRPWAKGFVNWPDGAPRIPFASPLKTKPRYPHMEYARANGVSKKYASSGWAAFERPFALWAEAQGIQFDYATQHDLHCDPELLEGYEQVVIVGHDEYWTWEMRDHLDAWIDQGGHLARFAGNFFWQTRLSDDLKTQTCYKSRAFREDPTPDRSRLTTYWDAPVVARPAVATMGLTGVMGVYAGWSRCAAHGSGGFTIYRPDHWAIRDSGLGYGDVLGASSTIFGYEVDGVDYTVTHGLPYATEAALRGELTIIAMSPATTLAHFSAGHEADAFIGTADAEEVAEVVYGGVTPETLARASHGNGMIAEYKRGKGAVLNAGSCEWVAGLIKNDPVVESVTLRILTGPWSEGA